MNSVSLIGRLVADPEHKQINDELAVTKMRLAVRRATRSNGEDRGAAFLDVEAWGKQADSCATYLKKGRKVAVSGYLEHQTWRDKTGNRQRVLIVARDIQFLDAPAEREERQAA